MKMLIEYLQGKKIDSNNILYFDLENQKYLDLCNAGVSEFIKYIDYKTNIKVKKYVFIDEIQYLNNPSTFLKQIYDHHSKNCKLIVSGSSSFEIKKKFKDSMAGRFFEFELFGLDFEEFLEFKNVKYNIDTKIISNTINEELKKMFEEFIIYGGYPRVVLLENEEQKDRYLQNIIGTYLRKDIREIGNVRDIERFNKILKILSANNGLLNINEISSTLGIARATVKDSIALLENTYVIKTVRPFFTNLRSELSKMPKIYFEDNGLRNILRFGEFVKVTDGLMFENAIFSILRKKGGKLKFWRTKSGQEIDFVVEKAQKIFGYEVKQTYSGKHPAQFKGFLEKYPKSILNIIVLNINKKNCKSKYFLFPWNI
jgi:predicted AAA+ superfamily ATPase